MLMVSSMLATATFVSSTGGKLIGKGKGGGHPASGGKAKGTGTHPSRGAGDDGNVQLINLGLPKSGSTSLTGFISCATNMTVSHWTCKSTDGKLVFCGICVNDNMLNRRRLLLGCGGFNAYGQLDYAEAGGVCTFPQHHHLPLLTKQYPLALYVIVTRPTEPWANSVGRWGNLKLRMRQCLPLDTDVGAFYDAHYARVRSFFRERPHLRLVEVNISAPDAGTIVANALRARGLGWQLNERGRRSPDSCWMQKNANPPTPIGSDAASEPEAHAAHAPVATRAAGKARGSVGANRLHVKRAG